MKRPPGGRPSVNLIDLIVDLDEASDWPGLQALVESRIGQIHDIVFGCLRLLRLKRLDGACLIARLLKGRAFNPALGLAQALGGIKAGDVAELNAGRVHLRATIDRLPADLQRQFYFELEPLIYNLIGNAFKHPNGDGTVRALTGILTDMTPPLRTVFDVAARREDIDLGKLRGFGAGRSRLRHFAMPQTRTPPRTGIVALRARFFPQDPASRPFEIGALIAAAMTGYGWTGINHGMEWDKKLATDLPRLVEACRRHRPDVLVMDEQVVEIDQIREDRAEALAQLRRELPALKVVGLYLDPWSIRHDALKAAARDVDLVWTFAPDLPVWREPEFAGKTLLAPLPYPPVAESEVSPLRPTLTFHGSVLTYNWLRWPWLTAFKTEALPVTMGLIEHKTDGLDPVDSFSAYLKGLARAGSVLNFGMRSDLRVATTGRTFEVLASGALLVQEAADELDNYLIAGEHYLPFTTFADLRAIIAFLQSEPEQANEIRRRGSAFFRQTYAPERIIGAMDAMLFPR